MLHIIVYLSVPALEAQPLLGEPGNADTDYLKVWLRTYLYVINHSIFQSFVVTLHN